jgi:hypothetical protein
MAKLSQLKDLLAAANAKRVLAEPPRKRARKCAVLDWKVRLAIACRWPTCRCAAQHRSTVIQTRNTCMEYLYETESHLGIIHTMNATERPRAVQGTN